MRDNVLYNKFREAIKLKTIKNKLIIATDPEIRTIRDLYMRSSIYDNKLISEYDMLFLQRLMKNPTVFKISFWEDHFEWKSVTDYPEINCKILDFGCESGHSDIFLARRGMSIHGVDLSQIGINIGNYLKSMESEEVRNRLLFSVVDITKDLPNGDLFDSAVSLHVFEHILDPGPILHGLRRWLKPRAYLLISVPLGYAYDDPGHVHHFLDTEQLKTHLSAYVYVERIDVSEKYQVLRALCKFD